MAYDYWIPCEDELPEIEDTYLVAWRPKRESYKGQHFYALMNFDDGEWQGKPEAADVWGEFVILAWMDLPPRFEE